MKVWARALDKVLFQVWKLVWDLRLVSVWKLTMAAGYRMTEMLMWVHGLETNPVLAWLWGSNRRVRLERDSVLDWAMLMMRRWVTALDLKTQLPLVMTLRGWGMGCFRR